MTHTSHRGFTLIEVIITLAILSLAVGVVVANWGAGSADLRGATGKLASTIRGAYDQAALSGRTYRLVLPVGKSTVRIEATDALLAFDDEGNALVRGAQSAPPAAGFGLETLLGGAALAERDEEGAGEKEEGTPSALTALFNLATGAQAEAGAGFSAASKDLDLGDVQVLDVWQSGMSEPAAEGDIYLYFFPNGYTQDTIIHLVDEDQVSFSIKVDALTGKTTVYDHYLEVPK
ncbi:MAG: type II secretion system protein [Deltaproteobacteria bacterium]|nr:type II secretion system protein [Deltaproteobacteria bacterium]